jgi:Zn finger protein HypA/HybF involved in hydrogenase expression
MTQTTKNKARVLISPPPMDGRCECCGRHVSELRPFRSGSLLVQKFRNTLGCIGPSWECRDCILLSDKQYKFQKRLSRHITVFCPKCRDILFKGTEGERKGLIVYCTKC